MATETQLIQLTWENGNLFKMQSKLNDDDTITIIEMHENGKIQKLWPDCQNICEKFFSGVVSDIGEVMKQ